MVLTDAAPRTSLPTTRTGATERSEHPSPIEGGKNEDHGSTADTNDATGSGVHMADHTDAELRLQGMAEDGDDEAPTPLSAKRKLLLLATGSSDDSNSAP